jgi:hypothetical protein
MELTDQEKLRVDRGLKAKEFLEGELYNKYLLPEIEKLRLGSYPKPSKEGWEEEYRMAYARDEVYTEFLQTILSWRKDSDFLQEKALEEEKDVVLA